ncbi:MAG: DUF3630 family protein [Pseudomonadota bacterium]
MADTEDTIVLADLPASESACDGWAQQLAARVNGIIREKELGADQFCWRLSIKHRHWLLFYSDLCEAAWLQPLEQADPDVLQSLKSAGYVK